MEPIIRVNNLSKEFKSRKENGLIRGLLHPEIKRTPAVRSISFSVQKGEAVAFLGPNGAGKTTTTKMLTGLIYPSSGTISVLDYTPFERHPDFLKKIGLVMGNKTGLNWDLTAKQSFDLLRTIYAIPEGAYQHRLSELTKLLDVKNHLDTQVRRLSLGERMKMELIGAIIHEPEILFLDEPTIGLDIITKKNIRRFLRTIQRERGTTLILTSHDMDDIEHVCDRVIIINQGNKVYDDSLKSLTDNYGQQRFVRFTFQELPSASDLQELATLVEASEDSYLFNVSASAMVNLIAKASAYPALVDIHIEAIPLEEIITDIFKGNS